MWDAPVMHATPQSVTQPEPWITVAEAAEWAGLPLDDMQRVVDARIFDIEMIDGTRKINECHVAAYCGLERPGPRETELIDAYWAKELEAQKKAPRRVVDNWLYWLYDADGHLLYVGITNSGVKRMEQHGAQKDWWPQVATIRVEHFATRDEAAVAELRAIREHLPIHNIAGAHGRADA